MDDGRTYTGGEINYYYQGMASAAYGWSSADYKLIWVYNEFYTGRSSEQQIAVRDYWANIGFNFYSRNLSYITDK